MDCHARQGVVSGGEELMVVSACFTDRAGFGLSRFDFFYCVHYRSIVNYMTRIRYFKEF